MEFIEAKERFLQAWGVFGSKWGINRTMAQMHALLLISPDPLSTEEIMNELKISRGNVNMNIRELMDWNLATKVFKPGERKEFFEAEKDIHKVAKEIAYQRRKREFEPMVKTLEELANVESDNSEECNTFKKTINDLNKFNKNVDKTLNTFLKAEENWFLGTLMKLMK